MDFNQILGGLESALNSDLAKHFLNMNDPKPPKAPKPPQPVVSNPVAPQKDYMPLVIAGGVAMALVVTLVLVFRGKK